MTFDRLAVIDLETTGVDIENDRIVQLAVVRTDGVKHCWFVNPGRPIPPLATEIHGITDEQVEDAPTFDQIAPEVFEAIDGWAIGTYNGRKFDVPFLGAELRRCGITWPPPDLVQVDARLVWDAQEPHTLASAVRRFLGEDHVNAHSALADATATLRILTHQAAQLQEYSVAALAKREQAPDWLDSRGVFRWKGSVAVITIGKDWAGKPLQQVDRGFLQWMLTKEFPEDTKQIARAASQGRYPRKGAA
jgi:DNA polymerase-3 subunit epsilon